MVYDSSYGFIQWHRGVVRAFGNYTEVSLSQALGSELIAGGHVRGAAGANWSSGCQQLFDRWISLGKATGLQTLECLLLLLSLYVFLLLWVQGDSHCLYVVCLSHGNFSFYWEYCHEGNFFLSYTVSLIIGIMMLVYIEIWWIKVNTRKALSQQEHPSFSWGAI